MKIPEAARPIAFHLPNRLKVAGSQLVGACPWCDKEGHLYVDPKTGKWDCKRCGESGNPVTFLTKLAAQAHDETNPREWKRLSKLRKIPVKWLQLTGAGCLGDRWVLPSRNAKGNVLDLRAWDGKRVISTAGCNAQLCGADELAERPGARAWLCEGEWDRATALWLIGELKLDDVAVSVPGANTFKPGWVELLAGREVICLYDHDEAGKRGAARAESMLRGKAKALRFVHWPKSAAEGYDLRDFLTVAIPAHGARAAMEELEELLRPNPPGSAAEKAKTNEKPANLADVEEEFSRRALVGEDLRLALRIVLAAALSNDLPGTDPLWIYLVGPPGIGKTLLLASLQESERCVFRSTVTPHGLVSGWRGEGTADPSLIPKLGGKTLVAKDFTEVLALPPTAQDEIFSTLRGAYDGHVEKSFGNGVTRSYRDCHFAMLAGVTNAIHGHAKASLGERFLKFQFRPPRGNKADAVIANAIGGIGHEAERDAGLREVIRRFLLRKIDPARLPRLGQEHQRRLIALVQLIAVLRAQVERDKFTQEMHYRPIPESGTRLARQLAKLAMMLAEVEGLPAVNEDTWKIVERVAFDTSTGFHLDVVGAMMAAGGSATKSEVCEAVDLPTTTVSRRFDDLEALGVVMKTEDRRASTGRPATVYQVDRRVAYLWKQTRRWEMGQAIRGRVAVNGSA